MRNRVLSFFLSLSIAVTGVIVPYQEAKASVASVVAKLVGMPTALTPAGVAVAIAGLGIGAIVEGFLFPTDQGTIEIMPQGQAAKKATNSVPTTTTTPATSYDYNAVQKWTTSTTGTQVFDTADAACNAAGAIVTAGNANIKPPYVYNAAGSICTATFAPNYPNGGYGLGSVSKPWKCESGGTLTSVNSVWMCKGALKCTDPDATLSGSQCVKKTCTAGMTLFPDGMCYTTPSSGSQPAITPSVGTAEGGAADRGDGWKGVPGTVAPGAAQPPLVGSGPLGVDGAASPTAVGIRPTTDGGVKVQAKTFDPAKGQTAVQGVTVAPSGVVTGTSSSVESGNTTVNVTVDGTSAPPVIFPEWLAHDQTIKTMDEKLTTERDAAGEAGAAEALKAQTAVQSAGGEEAGRWTKDALGLPKKDDFQAPETGPLTNIVPSDSECSSIPMTISGFTSYLDPCPLIQIVKPILNWGVLMMFGISTARYILGRREQE